MAAIGSFTIYQGSRATLNFTMSPVVNITGWAIKVVVAGAYYAATIVDGPGGAFQVILPSAVTQLLGAGVGGFGGGEFQYEAWRTDTDQEQLLAVGTATVLPADGPSS